jgi:hypothetical protein
MYEVMCDEKNVCTLVVLHGILIKQTKWIEKKEKKREDQKNSEKKITQPWEENNILNK